MLFISCAHDDQRLLTPYLEWLADLRVEVWLDAEIHTGSFWRDELAAAIQNAAAIRVRRTSAMFR